GMTQPTPRQLQQVARIFDLHPLAVEDAIVAHQRPKLERYNETLFVVLRPATYDDATETVKFGEIHAFIGPDFVITVRHTAQPVLTPVRSRFENDPDLLARGPQAVLYGLLDFIVDGYAPVAAGLENDIDEIETQVFESDPTVSRRIYELSQEVMELQRAVKPLQTMLRGLEAGAAKYGTDDEIITALRDVRDHVTSIVERNDNFRQSLSEILQLNAILVAQTQNEEMKRLAEVANNQADEVKRASSWAAILFAPTVVAGAYGMNFDRMPELHWAYGYPFALFLMVAVSFCMWLVFKRKNWL
ncbi:MAG: transporter, partial [Dermacoccus nishinomiyaensis]